MYIPNIFYIACLHSHCQQLQQTTCTACRLFVFGHDLVDALKYKYEYIRIGQMPVQIQIKTLLKEQQLNDTI